MLSILFGLACLAGLFHLNRHHFAGHHGACGHDAHHPRGRFRAGHRFLRHKLDRVLRAVRATPEQATEIRSVFDDLRGELENTKSTLSGQRRDLAEALRDDSVHQERVEVVFTAQRDALEGVQGAVKRALDRVHAVLDPVQRARLADFMAGERGIPFGPYR
jgi:uncharacterized membrane protein